MAHNDQITQQQNWREDLVTNTVNQWEKWMQSELVGENKYREWVSQPKMKLSNKVTDEEWAKKERQWGGWEWSWGGGLMHKNTLHQTKALLRAGCVSSPFMFSYFPLKDKTKRVRAKGDKVQENQRLTEREGKEGGIMSPRGSERVGETVSHLPAFPTTATLGSFARLVGMAGLLQERRGLKCGCCGDATVHLCLLLGQPVYSPKPHKAPESHRTRDCEH